MISSDIFAPSSRTHHATYIENNAQEARRKNRWILPSEPAAKTFHSLQIYARILIDARSRAITIRNLRTASRAGIIYSPPTLRRKVC
jgi:hypothetical protein